MKRLAAPLALVLLVLAVWLALPGGEREELEGLARDSAEVSDTTLRELASGEAASSEPGSTSAAREEAEATQEGTDGAATDSSLAEVRGRFLLPGGTPAVGVSVSLRGWTGNQQRALEYGVPADWQNPASVLTDADGRFRIELDPPPAFQFSMEATLAGYGLESWRWFAIEPAGVLDVGDTTLAPSGDVLVRLTDGDGRAISTTGWVVYGDAAARSVVPGKDDARARSHEPEADGRFRLVGLPAGPAVLRAYSRMAKWVEGPTVELVAGETLEVEIRYEGPDNSSRIVLTTFTGSFHTMNHDFESMRLLRDGVFVADAVKLERTSQSYSFEDLEAGIYTLEIEDRRFEPWSQSGVEPGSEVRAHLVGNAALALELSDDDSGERIEDYALVIRFEQTNWSPREFGIKALDDPRPEGGLYEGLLPVPQTLLISSPQHADLEVPLLDLAPNETRVVRARMVRGVRVRGRFTSALEVQPIANARVMLLPPGSGARDIPMPKGSFSSNAPGRSGSLLESRSDAAGRFEFPSVPPGDYALLGVANDWQAVILDPVSVEPGASEELALISHACAGLRGRVLGPEGASYADLVLRITPETPALPGSFAWGGLALPLAADGSFSCLNLPPGKAHLGLSQERVDIPTSSHSSFSFIGLRMDLGPVELGAGEILERDLSPLGAWPGSFEATLRAGAHPALGVVVELKAQGEFEAAGAALTDSDGVARMAYVAPGAYIVHVRSPLDGWTWNSGTLVLVQANRDTTTTLEYVVASGTLTLLDAADGTPLANQEFEVDTRDGGHTRSRRTDNEGRARLTLPLGRYRAGLQLRGSNDGQEFEWTLGGASPAELRFERP